MISAESIDGEEDDVSPGSAGWFLDRDERLTSQRKQQGGKNDDSQFRHGSRQISPLIIHLRRSLEKGRAFRREEKKRAKGKKRRNLLFLFLPFALWHRPSPV